MNPLRQTLHRGLDPIATSLGYELNHRPRTIRLYDGGDFCELADGLSKIQYACHKNLLADWVNVDLEPKNTVLKGRSAEDYVYFTVDLTQRHPFPSDRFEFAYGEDFLEHLTQADALIFLTEAFRTLAADGTLRLSFPGLEGVLREHYPTADYKTAVKSKRVAYDDLGHFHFFSREELDTVAKHIGFREVTYCNFGESKYAELRNRETRGHQTEINTYVELTK
jgi:predicted SAM-dependent methyltransferase